MGLQDCRVIFDNCSKTYYPGQVVTGRAEFTFNSPKTINGIIIRFKGEARTKWGETYTERDARGNTITRTRYCGAQEKYFDKDYLLCGNYGSKVTLSEGKHSYAFSFTLPQNLPSSFEGEYGNIRYTIKIILDRPWKFNQDMKVAFSVVSLVDLNLFPQFKQPVERHFKKTFCCLWCKSGPLMITTSLPYTGLVPGQPIPVQLKCNNSSNVDISSAIIQFLQVVVFFASNTYSTKSTRKTIVSCLAGTIEAGENKTFLRNIIIPPLAPSNFVNCKIIDLSYEIQITGNVPGIHRGFKIIVPIIIGTVPFITAVSDIEIAQEAGSSNRSNNLPPYHELYPNLPPPSYEESMFGQSIIDEEDSKFTRCDAQFAPRYPVFRYTLPTSTLEN